MQDHTFTSAGAAMAALVAGLAPGHLHAQPAPVKPAGEAEARAALAASASLLPAAEPFAAPPARGLSDIPLDDGALPFEDF